MWLHWLSAVIILVLLGSSSANDNRRWVPNTNFENAANWDGGNLPCANDKVTFPENLGAVFVQTNATITEMVLPLTGEILLGDYVSLSFPLEPKYTPGCPIGREVKYTRTSPKSWFDPSDWCVTASEGGDCQAEQPALLASEQVPCNSDTVSFPVSSSYLVSLGYGTDIYAGSLIVAGRHYTTATFKSYLDSEEGKRQFVRDPGTPVTTVTMTGNTCTDKSGCACGNDRGTILEKICQSPAGQCADVLSCTHTIKPMGACCDICGAVMKLDISDSFNKKDTENMILSKYVHGDEKYKDVKPIVSKTSLGQIQVVLTDAGDGSIAGQVATSLKSDFEGNSQYGVTGVKVDLSETVKPTPSGQTGGLESGGIAGVIIAVLIIVAIVGFILYFIVGKRRRPSLPIDINFDSVKSTFKNLKPKGQGDLELGTVRFNNSGAAGVENLSYGFDNPMYGDITPSGKIQTGSSSADPVPAKLEPMSDPAAGFSNPLYGSEAIQLDFENLGESRPEPEKKKKSKKASVTKSVDTPTYPDDLSAGFSNPAYGTSPVQVTDSSQQVSAANKGVPQTTMETMPIDTSDSAVLVLNPVFSTDGVEPDSFI